MNYKSKNKVTYMKVRFMIPFAFAALTACSGGSQQKSEEVTNGDGATSKTESACPAEAGAIDMAKVKAIWTEQVKKLNPDDEGTKFNKKAFYDIDGDGCNEVIFSEGLYMGFIGVFSNTKDGLELIDFANVGWQIGYIDIRPNGFVHTEGGSESGNFAWNKYSKLVNSKVEEVYYIESTYADEEEGGNDEHKCTLEKKGQPVKSLTKEEFDKAVPLNDKLSWDEFKWEDVQF